MGLGPGTPGVINAARVVRLRRLRRPRGDGGASALEMAILAPALLMIIFFAVQAGLYYYGRAVAIQAAREGVSQLRLAQDAATAEAIGGDVRVRTREFAVAVGRETLTSPRVDSTYDDDAGAVSVTVSGQVITLVPGLDLTVRETVHGRIERFAPDVGP
jgi:Flp pilus assembly protein TadG